MAWTLNDHMLVSRSKAEAAKASLRDEWRFTQKQVTLYLEIPKIHEPLFKMYKTFRNTEAFMGQHEYLYTHPIFYTPSLLVLVYILYRFNA